ncbi:MAG: hypothetical protein ACFB14_13920 [Leptolyngbyaceae cyanobacterium]
MADRLIPESELKAVVGTLVEQKLAAMLHLAPEQQHRRQWYPASKAYQLLDLDTAKSLHNLRRAGDLKEKDHWQIVGPANAKRPTYQYHVGNCREFLESARS